MNSLAPEPNLIALFARPLHEAHPTGRIGLPEEVAHLDFLNGSCLGLDGGIAGRLHDPV